MGQGAPGTQHHINSALPVVYLKSPRATFTLALLSCDVYNCAVPT